eukprot:443669-Pyramimonas_sp.AAC.1
MRSSWQISFKRLFKAKSEGNELVRTTLSTLSNPAPAQMFSPAQHSDPKKGHGVCPVASTQKTTTRQSRSAEPTTKINLCFFLEETYERGALNISSNNDSSQYSGTAVDPQRVFYSSGKRADINGNPLPFSEVLVPWTLSGSSASMSLRSTEGDDESDHSATAMPQRSVAVTGGSEPAHSAAHMPAQAGT